ncbi:hypothetical protein AgCh_022969 [Apium graveolens]
MTTATGKIKDGGFGLNYPMLTRENYTAWEIKMKVFMQAHGVWHAIDFKDPKKPMEERTDKIAMAAIYQAIPKDVLLSIAEKATTKEAWDAIKTLCPGAERVKRAKRLLRDVPSQFLSIASTIEQFGDLDKMSMKKVVGSLKAHEECLKGQSEPVYGGQLMLIEAEWQKRENMEGQLLLTREEWVKRSNSLARNNRGEYRSREGDRVARDRTKTQDDEPALLMVECQKKGLFLNEVHTSPQLNEDSSGKQGDSNFWYLDNRAMKIQGKGTVTFKCKNGEERTLREAYDEHGKLLMKVKRSGNRSWYSSTLHRSIHAPIKWRGGTAKSDSGPHGKKLLEKHGTVIILVGEAIRHSVYILNLLPTRALPDQTPYEALTVSKLDDRSRAIINIGKEPGVKGYRLYDPVTKSVHVSRDMVFAKNQKWPWTQHDKEESIQQSYFTVLLKEPVSAHDNEFKDTGLSTPITNHTGGYNSESSEMGSAQSGAEHSRYGGDGIGRRTDANRSGKIGQLQPGLKEKRMENEMEAIEKNETWTLTELPPSQKSIDLKWIFKLKWDTKGEIIKYKPRIVAKGYVKEQGVYFDEIFTPVT